MRSLEAWLNWQESLHPVTMDLGLERVRTVFSRMNTGLEIPQRSTRIITVAGTNGKGSSVTMLERVYRQAGYRTASLTSPHLLHYNERIRLQGEPCSDAQICQQFEQIDRLREEISLTYFEFNVLAALGIFAQQAVDIMMLEVGLGGRLDAVNIVDADLTLITPIDLDHTEWLGTDREAIGYEKAGICRPQRPIICGDRQIPQRIVEYAHQLAAPLQVLGTDFDWKMTDAEQIIWSDEQHSLPLLPLHLAGEHQRDNAATVIAALMALQESLPVAVEDIQQGLQQAQITARQQLISTQPAYLLDVTHNPHGATALRQTLAQSKAQFARILFVFGMLADKDAQQVATILHDSAACWFCTSLEGERARSGSDLAQLLINVVDGEISHYNSVQQALAAAQSQADANDLIVISGSFQTVSKALQSGLLPITMYRDDILPSHSN